MQWEIEIVFGGDDALSRDTRWKLSVQSILLLSYKHREEEIANVSEVGPLCLCLCDFSQISNRRGSARFIDGFTSVVELLHHT